MNLHLRVYRSQYKLMEKVKGNIKYGKRDRTCLKSIQNKVINKDVTKKGECKRSWVNTYEISDHHQTHMKC